MKKLLTVLCALFALSTASFAQRVAVVDFNAGVGISQQDVDGIAAIFNTYFSPNGYTLVERTTIDRVIDEQNFQRGKITEQQMVRLGQILSVSKIVIGDVNIVAGEYNIDVRVVNVESGTIAAKDGATWIQGSTYRELMKGLATRLANQIAITPQSTITASGHNTHTPATRCKVEVVFGYLKVFPTELGVFPSEPESVIKQINKQGMHDYDTWRLPTAEELALLRANGLVGGGTYMTSSTASSEGNVLLVTDATETHSAKQVRLAEESRIAEEKRIAEEIARKEAEEQMRLEKQRQRDIAAGLGDNGCYKFGYYYNRNGVKGVVVKVTPDGRHGLIVNLKNSDELKYHDAETWCERLGYGWRMPTSKEMVRMHDSRHELSKVLMDKGGDELYGIYWVSGINNGGLATLLYSEGPRMYQQDPNRYHAVTRAVYEF